MLLLPLHFSVSGHRRAPGVGVAVFGAELGGCLAGDAGERAVELGERLVSDVEGDLGDPGVGAAEFLFRPLDAFPVHVFGEGEAGGFFEEFTEVVFADPDLVGDGAEGERVAEVFVDEPAGASDRGGFGARGGEDEFVDVVRELAGEEREECDGAVVLGGLDDLPAR